MSKKAELLKKIADLQNEIAYEQRLRLIPWYKKIWISLKNIVGGQD